MIRIPIVDCWAWENYKTHWVQIDAPRHFFLHTTRSFEVFTEKTGLKIRDVVFDSTELQFWGSEQYVRGIPYTAENSYFINPKKSVFSKSEIKRFRKMAKDLNSRKQGDQAAFHLVKG